MNFAITTREAKDFASKLLKNDEKRRTLTINEIDVCERVLEGVKFTPSEKTEGEQETNAPSSQLEIFKNLYNEFNHTF